MEELMARYAVYLGLLLLVIEYVLGKTKLIKANSIIEAGLSILVSALKMLLKKDKDDKS